MIKGTKRRVKVTPAAQNIKVAVPPANIVTPFLLIAKNAFNLMIESFCGINRWQIRYENII